MTANDKRIGEIYQEHIAKVHAENDRYIELVRELLEVLKMTKERDEHFEEWRPADTQRVDEAIAKAELSLQ